MVGGIIDPIGVDVVPAPELCRLVLEADGLPRGRDPAEDVEPVPLVVGFQVAHPRARHAGLPLERPVELDEAVVLGPARRVEPDLDNAEACLDRVE